MKIKSFILPVLFSLSLSGLTGCNDKAIDSLKKENDVLQEDITINENGILSKNMSIKRMSSGTDENNHPYQTFSYTIIPADAAYTQIDVYVTFADNRNNAEDYLTVVLDINSMTFTITCLQAFDSVANVRLQATVGGAYADIRVDYQQKLTGSWVIGKDYTLELSRSNEDLNSTVNFKTIYENALDYVKTSIYTIPLNVYPTITNFVDRSRQQYGYAINDFANMKLEDYPNATSGSGVATYNDSNYFSWFLHALVYGIDNQHGFEELIDLNDSATISTGDNPFSILKNIWDNATNTQKGWIRRCLNEDGTFHLLLPGGTGCGLDEINCSTPQGNVTLAPSAFSGGKIPGDIHIHLRPFTSWNITKTTITSITPESPTIYF